MKKKILAALLAVLVFTTSAPLAYADNKTTEQEQESEPSKGVTTGTQKEAIENEVDVDADIEEEIAAVIPKEYEEIRIGTADEFLDMTDKCSLDTWSANKKIVLTADISLMGREFNGIPSFDGIFDGQGYTVSDFNIENGQSYVGFFTHIQKGAVVNDLKVTGSVMPGGSTAIIGGFCGENYGAISDCSFKGVVTGKDYVGGIAGINQLSGNISFCTSEGYINGTHFTGGIAGKNDGNIAGCKNEAFVNITNTDTEITIDSMEKLNTFLNLIRNGLEKKTDEANSDVTVTDIGGIAGTSIGIISRCINNGEIGYDHVGYNVGGIAGRQSGYLYNCTNNGLVKGRKDIGGIVGQAEPYITVDFATDIAYQLQEAVSRLHDTVAAALNDTKNQSDTISSRLAIIQNFTGKAVEDTRFLASGTVDFANGVSGAAADAFSRVDYVIEESSKSSGPLDNTSKAAGSGKKASKKLKDAVNDLKIEQYITSEDEMQQYIEAQTILQSAAQQYEENFNASYPVYYNSYIKAHRSDEIYGDSCEDLKYYVGDDPVDESNWSSSDDPGDEAVTSYVSEGTGPAQKGSWKHSEDETSFPAGEGMPQRESDIKLGENAAAFAESMADKYAMKMYQSPKSGETGQKAYEEDLLAARNTMAAIYSNHLGDMGDEVRKDASEAMNSIEAACGYLESAGSQTRSIMGNIAGRADISFPKFSDEYKAHITSLADDLAGMNDNFGLLNMEVNSTTGAIVGDLSAVNDEFNNILNLYTDALDGVLEKDYTNLFNDDSLSVAEKTTDATIDSCFNFGTVKGDIDVSGIAGTMAIEYDFDKESDVTGLKETGLTGSYLTKCVLRGDRNYGDVRSQKNYSGGVCGRQDMGTILNCGSYARIEALDGQYVGGVVGASVSNVVKSYAKGEIEGSSYVGGIAGDGKHIRDCLTIVTMDKNTDWSGAIAGHVAEGGEVRNNFFVSDELAGIDRVSYSMKAEPIDYAKVLSNTVFVENKAKEESEEEAEEAEKETEEEVSYRALPGEFGNLTVNFVIEDEDLEDGRQKVGKINKKYGDALTVEEYPDVDQKEGFYVDWDIDAVERLTGDMTITANYKRYKTTLAEDSISDEVNQSELLVDGKFRQEDELVVEKTVNVTEESVSANLDNYEVMKVKIPDDGQSTHLIRFKAINRFADLAGIVGDHFNVNPVLYLGEGEERTALEKTGQVGAYSTYLVEGNDLILSVSIEGAKGVAWTIVIIAVVAVIVALVIIIVIGINIKRKESKISAFYRKMKARFTQKIENKEQIFYDDSKDDKEK